MNKMMKTVSFLLALILCVGGLTACNIFPGGDNVPDDELDSSRYIIESEILFSSSDDKMQSAIEAMNSSVKTEVADGNIKVTSTTSIGETSVNSEYIYVEGTIYSYTHIQSGGYFAETFKKAALADEDIESVLNSIGAGVSVGIEDFNAHEIQVMDNGYAYICTDINSDAQASIKNVYGKRFGALGAELEISYVKLVLEGSGDLTKALTLEIGFIVDMDGESYEVDMKQTSEYIYGSDITIFAPNNVFRYEEVSYEEIVR